MVGKLAGRKKSMIYLDTHVVLLLYGKMLDKFSPKARELLEAEEILISPMVCLELNFLKEINRITYTASEITDELMKTLGITICNEHFHRVILLANDLKWARDPFDRIIVANALVHDAILITKDKLIIENYKKAIWD